MTKSDRTWCIAYAVFLAALTSVPYFMGFTVQGEAWHFTGFVFGVEDGNSYIAKMLLGGQGDWLFRTPYTVSHQRGVIGFFPYLILGKLAAGEALHEQLVALFHLFRILSIPAIVLAIYRFVAIFLPDRRWRRWVTILGTIGGGLGWILPMFGVFSIFGTIPLSFYSPETFGFLAIFGLPHLILGRAFLFMALTHYLLSPHEPKRGWVAGLLILGLTLIQPVAVIPIYVVIVAHQAAIYIRHRLGRSNLAYRDWFQSGVRSLAVPLPMVGYLAYMFNRDPFLSTWTTQNRILSPHPIHYLLAYGLILAPALVGGWRLIQKGKDTGILLVVWGLSLPFLAYAPYNLQRRLPEGVWIALLTMAAIGIAGMVLSLRSWNYFILWMTLLLSIPSSLVLIAGGLTRARNPAEPVFRPADEIDAALWFRNRVPRGSAVLSAFETGNVLPAWIPIHVVIGHGPESVDLATLVPEVEAFYNLEMTNPERRDFLVDKHVDFVWHGPYERRLGDWDPESADYLEMIYTEGLYSIYRVVIKGK
jgi:hypothetical protein